MTQPSNQSSAHKARRAERAEFQRQTELKRMEFKNPTEERLAKRKKLAGKKELAEINRLGAIADALGWVLIGYNSQMVILARAEGYTAMIYKNEPISPDADRPGQLLAQVVREHIPAQEFLDLLAKIVS